MSGSIRLRRTPAGECVITPTGTDSPPPTVLADEPDVDVAVLEVAGGHLTWSVLADTPIACAVLDDVEAAQSWLWALYGERVAVVVDALAIEPLDPDERPEQELPIDPVHPDLVARAHRLAFAQWALRWWPASAIDDIPPLDRGLLEREITELIEECDQLFDGIDAAEAAGVADRPGEIDDLVDSEPGTARDYALAAGAGGTDNSGGSVLAGGNGGSDWRCYPPGLIDAAETAVSWELVRIAARTVVEVSVVAAPGLDAPDSSAMPTHLLPRAPCTRRPPRRRRRPSAAVRHLGRSGVLDGDPGEAAAGRHHPARIRCGRSGSRSGTRASNQRADPDPGARQVVPGSHGRARGSSAGRDRPTACRTRRCGTGLLTSALADDSR